MSTVTQIAKAAGVSRVCASQVLNDTPNTRVSRETRNRILKIAREVNFVPRSRSQQAKSSSIAYMLCAPPDPASVAKMFSNGGHFRVLHHLQQLAAHDNRVVTFLSVSNETAALEEARRLLQFNPPLGVVLESTVTPAHVQLVQELGLPLVVTGVTSFAFADTEQEVPTVSIDPRRQVRRLLDWFKRQGCRRVALATGPMSLLINSIILDAYRQYTAALGLATDTSLIQISDSEQGDELCHRYAQLGVEYDGILFGNWGMTAAAKHLVETRMPGCRIGTFGFTGLPDREIDGIATCGPSIEKYTSSIYDLLNKQIHGRRHNIRHVLVPDAVRCAGRRQDGSYSRRAQRLPAETESS